MGLLDSIGLLSSPVPLAVACATVTLLAAHRFGPAPRPVMTRWALGALLFWSAGAGLAAWYLQGMPFHAPWPGPVWHAGMAPAAGLIALLIWTLWHCRRHPALRRRLCALIMITSGLWWGLEQWRSTLQAPLPDALPPLAFESLEGRSVIPAHDDNSRYLLLWRSDCRACRRWLQQLAQRPADQRPAMVLVNQGETLLSVIRYLDQHPDQQLGLKDTALLMDPRQRLLALTHQRHLPVLLHVAADGALTLRHELSAPAAPTLR
ncbi:hypothetical protein M1D97_13700 [Kushneria sp. AK178]